MPTTFHPSSPANITRGTGTGTSGEAGAITTGMGVREEATAAGGLGGAEFKDVTPTTFHSGTSPAEVTATPGRAGGAGALAGVAELSSVLPAATTPPGTGKVVMPAIFQSLVPAARSASVGIRKSW